MDKQISNKKYCLKLVLFCLIDIVILLFTIFNKKGVKTLNPKVIVVLVLLSLVFIILSAIFKLKNKKISYYLYQLTDTFYLIMVAIVVVQVVFLTLFFPARVSGPSMYDTLVNEQFVLCNSNTNNLKREDVVVVYVNEEIAKGRVVEVGEYLVKRVVAVCGDEVRLESSTNMIWINGVPLCKLNSSVNETITFTLKENEVYVIGDNYGNSYDSRNFGVISTSDVIGIVRYKCIELFKWDKVK